MDENDNTLPSTTFAHVDSVTNVNHNPHPFMVGTKNVVYASDHNGGMLTQSVMDKVGCEWQDRPRGPYCGLPTSAHQVMQSQQIGFASS